VLSLAGIGVFAGWALAYYLQKIPLKFSYYLLPLILPIIAILGNVIIFTKNSFIQTHLAITGVFIFFSFCDKVILQDREARLKYFNMAFFGSFFLLSALGYFSVGFSGYVWVLLPLIPFFVFFFMVRNYLKRIYLGVLITFFIVFQYNIHPDLVYSKIEPELKVPFCYLPDMEKLEAVKWSTPNPGFQFYKKAEILPTNRFIRNSIAASNLSKSSGWLEYISQSEYSSNRKGKWYINYLLSLKEPVLIILDNKEHDVPQKISNKEFFNCIYYYNRNAIGIFNPYWDYIDKIFKRKDKNFYLDEKLDFEIEQLQIPYTPLSDNPDNYSKTNNIHSTFYQEQLKKQLFLKLIFLFKKNEWQLVEDYVSRYYTILRNIDGFIEFLEKFYSSIQNQKRLLEMLLHLYQKDQANDSLVLRIAGIYARNHDGDMAIEFASKIKKESKLYRKALNVIVENKIFQNKLKDALKIVEELIKRFPDDLSLKNKKDKIIERIQLERLMRNKNIDQKDEAKRIY
jgi:hypothetical protein